MPAELDDVPLHLVWEHVTSFVRSEDLRSSLQRGQMSGLSLLDLQELAAARDRRASVLAPFCECRDLDRFGLLVATFAPSLRGPAPLNVGGQSPTLPQLLLALRVDVLGSGRKLVAPAAGSGLGPMTLVAFDWGLGRAGRSLPAGGVVLRFRRYRRVGPLRVALGCLTARWNLPWLRRRLFRRPWGT